MRRPGPHFLPSASRSAAAASPGAGPAPRPACAAARYPPVTARRTAGPSSSPADCVQPSFKHLGGSVPTPLRWLLSVAQGHGLRRGPWCVRAIVCLTSTGSFGPGAPASSLSSSPGIVSPVNGMPGVKGGAGSCDGCHSFASMPPLLPSPAVPARRKGSNCGQHEATVSQNVTSRAVVAIVSMEVPLIRRRDGCV